MTDHSPERVAALAEAFKDGWHKADDANLPDRTHHGILAVLESAEMADRVAHKVHEALERAAEAVRMSEWHPRYVMGIDTSDALADHTLAGIMRVMAPEPAAMPRRLCDLSRAPDDTASTAADELQRLNNIGQTRRDLISGDDWEWFCNHPLTKTAKPLPAILPALIEWLRS